MNDTVCSSMQSKRVHDFFFRVQNVTECHVYKVTCFFGPTISAVLISWTARYTTYFLLRKRRDFANVHNTSWCTLPVTSVTLKWYVVDRLLVKIPNIKFHAIPSSGSRFVPCELDGKKHDQTVAFLNCFTMVPTWQEWKQDANKGKVNKNDPKKEGKY